MTSKPEHSQEQDALASIALISRNIRVVWFSMLGALLICVVALLNHKDKDFFEYGAATQLPLLGAGIPPYSFFICAPLLVLSLHVYLNTYLFKFWRALSSAPNSFTSNSSQKLEVSSAIFPWLLAPMLLAAFWVRSMPLHDQGLTLLLGLLLCLSLWLGARSGSQAWRIFGQRQSTRFEQIKKDAYYLTSALLLFAVILLSLRTTRGELWAGDQQWLYKANLARAQLSKPSPDYPPLNQAMAEFRDTYIAQLQREHGDKWREAHQGAWELKLAKEFEEYRSIQRRRLEMRDLSRADLRHADMTEAHLDGLPLIRARLQNADLQRASMEGADLRSAQMQGANLSQARMEGANLESAQMQEAVLEETRMQGAELRDADMQGANLREAQMQHADLWRAQLQEADLEEAHIENADLQSVQMDGANLIKAQMQGADLREAEMKGANLRDANLQGANLGRAQMRGASLHRAQLRGAALQQARMEGANFQKAQLDGACVAGAAFAQRPRSASETKAPPSSRQKAIPAKWLTQAMIDRTFGDAATVLPDGLERPKHWAEEELDLKQASEQCAAFRASLKELTPPAAAPIRR